MFQIFFFSNKTFDGILPDEKVIFLVRKHKIFFYLPIFLSIFLALIVVFLIGLINVDFYNKFSNLILFLEFIYFGILWLVLFFELMIYSLTTLIITNKRIIKIEEKGLFNYDRVELELDRIQDINVNISGIFGNFLNFGDISIQTAGAETRFNINNFPRPLKIKNLILETKSKFNLK